MKKNRTNKRVLEFTEMMELLIESGLSLRDALEVLGAMRGATGNTNLAGEILGRIRKGVSFAAAVCSMQQTFPPIYRGMIKVGDKAGSVEQIFPRLSAYLKDQKKLRDKVAAALAYPILVLSLAIAGSAGLILFVLPKMETIFGSFGGNSAEQIHRNINTIKTLMLCFLCVLGFCTGGAIVLKRLSAAHKELARTLDYQLLRLPLLGAFLSSWESLNFSFAMEVLTGGGVPIEAALPEAEAVVSNRAYRRALRDVRTSVINGGSLSRAFGEQKIFPAYLSRWIAIGESSGRTEKIFSQVRIYFQEEIDKRTGRFLLLIEPVLIVAIGIVILCLVTGIILPLFSVYGNLL